MTSTSASAGNDRSTRDLIIELGKDLDRCIRGIFSFLDHGKRVDGGEVEASPMFDFHGRQAVRTLFAYLEGVSFALRAWSVVRLLRMDKISDEERLMAFERRFELNDAGDLVERPARITLVRNIKFTFHLLDRVRGIETRLESQHWWAALLRSIKVRDRLMHPRMPSDLDVSEDEILDVLAVEIGFRALIDTYGNLGSELAPLEEGRALQRVV